MVAIWINPDGSGTPIHNAQDAAAALDNDPETADRIADTLADEVTSKDE